MNRKWMIGLPLIIAISLIVIFVLGYAFKWNWVGVVSYAVVSPEADTLVNYESQKTLWDWMDLLIIPLALLIGVSVVNWLQQEKAEQAEIRQRATLVGQLLAEWISLPDEQVRLNELAFEAFLWLPEDIARDLGDRLANRKEAPTNKELLVRARKHLLGESDGLTTSDITEFTQHHKQRIQERKRVIPVGG